MALDITVDTLNATSAVVAVHGSLTLGSNLKMVEGQVQQLIEEGVRKLVLDLTDCQYSDSAGLGFLIHTFGLVSGHGGTIRLCGVSDRVLEMLKMTKTDVLMPIDADRQASVGKL